MKGLIMQIENDFLESIIEKVLRRTLGQNVQINSENRTEMTQAQAAEYLGISLTTIIEWKRRKMIPFHQIPGTRKIKFYKDELDLVLEQNRNLLKMPKK